MTNRIFQEDHAKDCQEIEELRRTWCEEAERARQFKIDGLSFQQRGNPSTVNQLLAQIQDLQDKVSSLNGASDLYDPETASCSGVSHVPSQPLNIPSPRRTIIGDSCLPQDTRNSTCTSGNVSESLPSRDGPFSAFFDNPKNLASSSCGLRPSYTGTSMKRGQRVETRAAEFYNTDATICQESSTWTPFTSEVEIAISKGDLMTSQSIEGRRDVPDFEMLDAKIASARSKVSVEEQRAQKYDRFFRGRQIVYMICDHFRATGAYDAAQGLSHLLIIRLQNDDVQDFDVRGT